MSDSAYLLESTNDVSGRRAIFDDDGTSAWLYLTGPNDNRPVADVWVHNRISAPPSSEIASYRGGPPPAAIGYTDDSCVCHSIDEHTWTLAWHQEGRSASLTRDGQVVALVAESDRSGWSKNLLRDGPWGKVWSNQIYAEITQCNESPPRNI